MNPGIGASRGADFHRAGKQPGQRVFQYAGDGSLVRLVLESAKSRAVVLDGQA
jgi:hypothetical protein